MVAPTLGIYEYQYKDTGYRLNGVATVPFFNATAIDGLSPAQLTIHATDIDGQHGGSGYVKYYDSRRVVIDGILYATGNTIDTELDVMKANFIPDNVDYPFYFKTSNGSQRYIMCKPIGFNYKLTSERGVGTCTVQIQLFAGDPLMYTNNANYTLPLNTQWTPTNSGIIATFPTVTITGVWTTLTISSGNASKAVVLNTAGLIATDIVTVNFKTRSVTLNGALKNSIVTSASWWDIPPSNPYWFKVVAVGGTPTVSVATKNGWI